MILFITRKYPPSKGGMESVSYNLYENMKKITDIELIKWSGSQKWLPFVIPYFFLATSLKILKNNIKVIHLGDGLLAPLGVILKFIYRKEVTVTIHALDITYKSRIYQSIIPKCVGKLDRVICVSNYTKNECIKREIDHKKITVIPNGVNPNEFYIKGGKKHLRKKLENKFNIKLQDKKIILSVGRLVERKGFHWFVENVMPKLVKTNKNIFYLIAGDGPYRNIIEEKIKKNKLENFVFLLGKVDDETLRLLYNSSDVFVSPNIHVEGDAEGFGVVNLEAASCGLSVVASNIEGVRDSIIDGKNGFKVKEKSYENFLTAIKTFLAKNSSIRKSYIKKYTKGVFGWDKISRLYCEELSDVKKS